MKCTKCLKEKKLEEFHRRSAVPSGRRSHCKDCMKVYNGNFYKTSETRREKLRTSRRVYIEKNRKFLSDYKSSHPCVDCGEIDPVCLDFDHVRGKKVANICEIYKHCSLETLRKEIEKCELRCANCHRKITAKRRCSIRVSALG